jgi:site-specific DNA recombinase
LAVWAGNAAAGIESRRRDLLLESKRLSCAIATVSLEGKHSIDKFHVDSVGTHRRASRALEDADARLQELERRMVGIECEIAALDAAKVEAGWIAQCLRDFDAVWDVLTSQNRGRLLRAIVERVDVDDEYGEVRTTLADLTQCEKENVSA